MAFCKDCVYCAKNRCKKYGVSIPNTAIPVDCKNFSDVPGQQLKPKGIQIRDNKRKKNNAKMRQITESQLDICRFIQFEYLTYERINGKIKPDKMVGGIGANRKQSIPK